MPKRTYWDRSLCKDVRDVYRPKAKQKKAPYTSKAYRAAVAYHRWRFAPPGEPLGLTAKLINASMLDRMNSPGFMRRYLHKVRGDALPTKTVDPWYEAYKAEEPGSYKARNSYAIPDRASWKLWTPEEVANV